MLPIFYTIRHQGSIGKNRNGERSSPETTFEEKRRIL